MELLQIHPVGQEIPDIATMQGGIQVIFSHGNVLKNAVLQQVRVVTPSVRALMFSRHESTSAARIEEHGFESTKISDVLTAKRKGADGSWLWCTTDDSMYDAVKLSEKGTPTISGKIKNESKDKGEET